MPVFRLEKVVYRRSLLSMNSILILTRPLVFFPFGGGTFFGFAELLLWFVVFVLLLFVSGCWEWWWWCWLLFMMWPNSDCPLGAPVDPLSVVKSWWPPWGSAPKQGSVPDDSIAEKDPPRDELSKWLCISVRYNLRWLIRVDVVRAHVTVGSTGYFLT